MENLIGKRIIDNDPRMPGRILTVTRIENGRAVASVQVGSHQHETRIALTRIFWGGKPRRTGWSVL